MVSLSNNFVSKTALHASKVITPYALNIILTFITSVIKIE